MKHYDIAVIGSGAGLIVLDAAMAKGLRCALIEKKDFGGTCLNRGCIPSKMLVYPADTLRSLRHAAKAGIFVEGAHVDWPLVRTRILERLHHREDMRAYYQNHPLVDVYPGHGAFVDAHTLTVTYEDGRADTLTADKFVLAMGARSMVPDVPGLDTVPYYTYERFFDDVPLAPFHDLTILGSGIIAAEFAHIFSALGARVTLIGRSGRLLKHEDREIADCLTRSMEAAGISLYLNHRVESIQRTNGKVDMTLLNTRTGERLIHRTEDIFVATGVQGNADLTQVANTGIVVSPQGFIETTDGINTAVPHIFALGDINGKHLFRHTANMEAYVLADRLFENKDRAVNYATTPWAVYALLQIGHVGMTEEEVQMQGIPYQTGKKHLSEIVTGWSMEINQDDADDGFAKIITDKNGTLLGAHVIGYQAAALVQPFALLMNTAANNIQTLQNTQPIHPSVNELTYWAIENMEQKGVPTSANL